MLTATREHSQAERLQREIVKGCQAIRSAWIYLAARLHELDEGELWRPLGFRSLREFLSQPEIELSYSHARLLIRSYRELVVEQGLDAARLQGVSIEKMRFLVGPIRTGRLTVNEALAEARSLGAREIQNKYRGQGQWAIDRTDVEVCPTCGARRKK